MIAGSLEIQLMADLSRLQQDMQNAKRMSGDAMGAIETSMAGVKAAIDAMAVAENARATLFSRTLSETKRLLGIAKVSADETAKSLGDLKINPDALKIPSSAYEGLKTWQEKSAHAIGAGVAVGMDKAKTLWQDFKDFTERTVVIWGVAMATGITAAVLSAVYAAYKAISFGIGLITGESYKSANIDALVAMNKEVKTLQEALPLTAVGASALNEALKVQGASATAYASTINDVASAVRSNGEELDRLGVKYQDQNGNILATDQILKNASVVLAAYTEGWDRNEAAQAIGMGSEKQIQDALAVTATKVQTAKDRLIAYGLVIGVGTQEAVAIYEESMRAFERESDLTSQGFKRAIADNIMPVLTDLADFFREGFPFAVMAFRYSMATVTSLFYGLKTVAYMVAESVVGSISAIGMGLGGLASAALKALTGDFSGAKDALVQGWVDAKARLGGIGDNIVEQARRNAAAMALAWGSDNLGANSAENAIKKVGKAWEAAAEDEKEAAASVESAYQKLMKEIGGKIAVQELELQGNENLTEGQKLAAKVMESLRDGTFKLTEEEKKHEEQLKRALAAALEKLIVDEKAIEIKKAMAKASEELIAAGKKELDSIQEQLKKQKEHNAAIGLSKEQVAELAAKKLELAATSDDELASNMRAAAFYAGGLHDAYLQYASDLEKAAKLKRELASGQREGAAKEAAFDAAKKLAEEWKRDFDRIEDWIGDAIGRGVTKGKDIWKSLIDGLEASFARLILRPIIAPIAAFGASMLSPGAAQAQGAGGNLMQGMDLFRSGKSLWDGFNSGFSGLGNTISSYVQQGMNAWSGTSSVVSNGWASAEGGAGYLSSGASMAGTAAGYAAGAIGGHYVGRAISNGYAVSGSGNGVVNAGTLIGTVLGGPIGSLVGGAIGGLINRAFGRKLVDSGIEGNISGSEFTGNSFEFLKGGWFRSDKTNRSALDPMIDNVLSSTIEAMHKSFAELGKTVGAGSAVLDGFSHSFKLSMKGMSEEDAQKALQRTLAATSDAMAGAFVEQFRSGKVTSVLEPYVTDISRIFDKQRASLEGVKDAEGQLAEFTKSLFVLGAAFAESEGYLRLFGESVDFAKLEAMAKSGETVLDAFARLNTVFSATGTIAVILGKDAETAFGAVGLASTDARERLINLAGGLDALASGAAFFTQNFLSEAEQIKLVSEQVTDVFSKFGIAGDSTKQQFVDIVKGLDLSTESDAKMYAELVKIAPAFLTVANYADSLIQKAKELATASSNLDIEHMELTGDTTGATAARRAMALENADPSLRAQMSRNFAAQDAKAAIERAMADISTAFSTLQNAVEAERTAVTNAYNASVKALNERIQDVNGSISKLSSLSSTLKSTLNSMRLPSDLATERASAQAQIQTALAIARAGGVLPDAGELQSALSILSRPNEELYGSFVDFQREYLRDRGAIAELASITDAQMSVEEKTLQSLQNQLAATEAGYLAEMERLDGVLTYAQQQIDALNGIDTSVKSVGDAIANLQVKLAAASGATAPVGGSAGGSTGGASSGIIGSAEAIKAVEAYGQQYGQDAYYFIEGVNDYAAKARNIANLSDLLGQGTEALWETVTGHSEAYWQEVQRQLDEGLHPTTTSIPGFATGGDHVGGWRVIGERGPELEATGPSRIFSASQTSEILRGGSNNEALIAEIRALRAEVAQLRETNSAENISIARHASSTAKTLQRAMPDGDALSIREAKA